MALNALKNHEEGFLVSHLFCSNGDNITSPITTETLEFLTIWWYFSRTF